MVTKRLPDPVDSLRLAKLQAERSSPRRLKVEVTAAELLPAMTGIGNHWPLKPNETNPVDLILFDTAESPNGFSRTYSKRTPPRL